MSSHRIQNLKNKTPWFLKIPAKILLSRIPVHSRRWQRLNLFKAGVMDDPGSAFELFRKHMEGAKLRDLAGRNVLELGPGNSALTALFARSFGAARTWLVDAERLASEAFGVLFQDFSCFKLTLYENVALSPDQGGKKREREGAAGGEDFGC